jgi:PAS domain S-box-containing protein
MLGPQLLEKEDRFAASQSDEGRYRLLVEAVTDYAIYMLDENGIVSSWNPGARRFKGYAPEEIIGQHFSRFYSDQDRAAGLPERALRIAREQGKFENEGWRIRKDGTRFWAHVIIDPVLKPNGEVIGFAKITRDLTERRAAEADLRASHEQFRLLVQGVTDYAIYMLDPDGKVSSWNAGAQHIKGYEAEEIIGQHFSRFYTDADRAAGEPQKALETARHEGRFEKEGQRVRKNGEVFTAHVVIDPIRDDKGALIGFAKITRDVSERKAQQAELEKAREALFQSQKMDAVGQLTGGIAHDFNNLLMAILGSLELAKKRLPDDPNLKRLIDNAMQGARRGSTLTQRMLAFARRQALEPRAVDLGDLVRNMLELMERSIGPGVHIDTRIPMRLKAVHVDQNQLEMALVNLIVNARDAMPQGGNIHITASEEELKAGHESGLPPGGYVRLSIRDEGEGMDAQTLQRAIEPFFTTKGVGKGTGLGLPMVHGMVEQIGGRFELKSEKGKGTEAVLWLPLAEGVAGDFEIERPAETPKPDTLTVLAVDDDALVLFNTTAMLEDLGHTAIEARSGKEALEILRKQKVDLVVTDQAMPQMTGAQLAEAIKTEWPGLPVILATGYAELPGGQGKDLPKLSKPFDERALASAIAQNLA